MAANLKSKTPGVACKGLWLSGVILVASVGGAAAQDDGGLSATFDITQSFENRTQEGFSGSADRSEFRSLTTLAFGLSSITRSQSLSFGTSSGIAAALDGDRSLAFEDNLTTFDYARSNRDTALTFGARFRRDEIDDLVFDASLADVDIATGEGLREVLTLNSGLIVGREARVTGTFNHTYETSSFSDTIDPTLTDSETQIVDARVSFQITRTFTADIFADWTEVDAQGPTATDRETARVGVGADFAVDPATTLTGEVSYREEESRGVGVVRTEGLGYRLSLVRDRPRGPINVNFSQEDALTGVRRQLSAGQDLVLKRGNLGFALGATKTEGFDPQVLANVTFDYELDRNSTTRFFLSQEGTINGDDQEVVNSRLDLSYTRELTPLSQISANFALVDENVLEAGVDDQRSIQFGVSYDYELAQDWGLTSGYQFSSVRLEGVPDRNRKTVFIGLQKRFAYRP